MASNSAQNREVLQLDFAGFRFRDNHGGVTDPVRTALLTLPVGAKAGQLAKDVVVYRNCLSLLCAACSALELWTQEAEKDNFQSAIHNQWPLATPASAFFAVRLLLDARRRFRNRHDRLLKFPIKGGQSLVNPIAAQTIIKQKFDEIKQQLSTPQWKVCMAGLLTPDPESLANNTGITEEHPTPDVSREDLIRRIQVDLVARGLLDEQDHQQEIAAIIDEHMGALAQATTQTMIDVQHPNNASSIVAKYICGELYTYLLNDIVNVYNAQKFLSETVTNIKRWAPLLSEYSAEPIIKEEDDIPQHAEDNVGNNAEDDSDVEFYMGDKNANATKQSK
ncbi:hypothetical protein F5Y04DRAFT_293540 [Hypomontagnella monticulosa]|nr:hypothetical protein F5Y04DRAFT_293540 [Hypomontagnella monticulosa]